MSTEIEKLHAENTILRRALAPRLSLKARKLVAETIEAEEAVGDRATADAIRFLLEMHVRAILAIEAAE